MNFLHGGLWCLMAGVLLCAGCGSSGSHAGDPPPATAALDTVTVTGAAAWPGATILAVTIDGVAVPVVGGQWHYQANVAGALDKTIRVAVIADGVTVAQRDVRVHK